nr:glycosyltransferase family A protein [uncultured Chitinophaga sp.]
MALPRIEAVIPCYNDGRYLRDCITSLQEQSSPPARIHVVDDASTDKDTLGLYKALEKEGVHIIYRKKNGGISAARNTGIRETTSDLVLLIDADDCIDHRFLRKAARLIRSDASLGAVSAQMQAFGDYQFTWKPAGGSVGNFLFSNNSCSMSLIRKNAWEQAGMFDESISSYEDWEFWLRLTAGGWHISIIPQLLFYYRMQKSKSNLLNEGMPRHTQLFDYIVKKNLHIYDGYIAANKPDVNIHFLVKYLGFDRIREIYDHQQ